MVLGLCPLVIPFRFIGSCSHYNIEAIFIEAMDTKEPLSQEPPPGDANQFQPVPVLSPSDQPYYINAGYNITDPILTHHLYI